MLSAVDSSVISGVSEIYVLRTERAVIGLRSGPQSLPVRLRVLAERSARGRVDREDVRHRGLVAPDGIDVPEELHPVVLRRVRAGEAVVVAPAGRIPAVDR